MAGRYGFALPALFICLMIMQLTCPSRLVVMLIAGITALFFKAVIPGNWYIILAALLAMLAGLVLYPERVWR